jgi:hypothetical protein
LLTYHRLYIDCPCVYGLGRAARAADGDVDVDADVIDVGD